MVSPVSTNLALVFYDGQGRIVQLASIAPTILAQRLDLARQQGLSWVQGDADIDRDYVLPQGSIAPRPNNSARLDGTTLRDLPQPCRIRIGGEVYDCPDEFCELHFDLPGPHIVTVLAWPYLDREFRIEDPPQSLA